MRKSLTLFMIALGVALTAPYPRRTAQGQSMSFFVSSTGSGMGGNLGGLAGADKHCQTLAAKAGAGNRTWRAYLSTSMPDVNARDRIGSGPWYNAKGTQIASNVADLHSDKANINNDTALDEQGRPINSQGAPNRHDILTGSTVDGTGRHDDLPELDEQRRRPERDAGTPRSPHVRQTGIALELGPPVKRLLAGEPGRDRRSRVDLLFRGQIIRARRRVYHGAISRTDTHPER